jgi:hypothetical protein
MSEDGSGHRFGGMDKQLISARMIRSPEDHAQDLCSCLCSSCAPLVFLLAFPFFYDSV